MAALGMATIQSAQAADAAKNWSVAASLRGFYDDNPNTIPDNAGDKQESFGFEVSPMLSFDLPLERTPISASYRYSYKWYDHKVNGRDGRDRQTHTFGARLSHSFSERLAMSVQDSFVIGQEPEILRAPNSAEDTHTPIPGDNIRNYGALNVNAQVTPLFGVEVGYANALFDYADSVVGGNSARLDRLEHSAHVDTRWNVQRDTVLIVGYQFTWVDYTADLPLAPLSPFMSNSRNSRSHYGYVGAEHTFRPDLVGTVRGGIRYSDYYNANHDDVAPYAEASLTYSYAKESHIEAGVKHDRSATDQLGPGGSNITLEADTTVAYLSLVHRIVPDLFGSVVGFYQHSAFVGTGGVADSGSENYYGVGVNLKYQFNPHVAAEVGYNYDRLDGNQTGAATRDYDRNRAYVGATFAY
jgi:hypothetical protein